MIDFATLLDLGVLETVRGTLNAGLLNVSGGLEILFDLLFKGVSYSAISITVGSFSGSGALLPKLQLRHAHLPL